MRHPVDLWLERNGKRKAALATDVGISVQHLNRLLRADPTTSYTADLFGRLSEAMNGELTPEELFAEFEARRRARAIEAEQLAEGEEADPAAA